MNIFHKNKPLQSPLCNTVQQDGAQSYLSFNPAWSHRRTKSLYSKHRTKNTLDQQLLCTQTMYCTWEKNACTDCDVGVIKSPAREW